MTFTTDASNELNWLEVLSSTSVGDSFSILYPSGMKQSATRYNDDTVVIAAGWDGSVAEVVINPATGDYRISA